MQAAAAGHFEQASRHLSTALAEWRGPVLEDLRDFQFVDAFATALVEDKVVAHTARAEAEIACGARYAVIGELEALTAEHPYREPLWAQLITAYYLTERQSDALDAYRRLKTTLADDLGIDPGPTVQRPARADPAPGAAGREAGRHRPPPCTRVNDPRPAHRGRRPSPPSHGYATRPGTAIRCRRRPPGSGDLSDNDIVLDDAKVSRHHAVIIDTGTSFVITDLRSANGVDVQASGSAGSATLADGDRIRICDHEFTFENPAPRGVAGVCV